MKKIQAILGAFLALAILSVTAVAAENSVDKVILASNANYPDAIFSSAVSQKLGTPVLLTDKAQLSEETVSALDELQPSEVIVVGGPAVVSDQVIQTLEEDYEVTRLWGMSRYGTAEEVAAHFWLEGADRAMLVENNMGEEKGNVLGAAKNLANGNPVLPIPEGKIPANVLSQLEELGVSEVTIVGTEVTDDMETDLSDLGIQISEKIQAQNEEKLQERLRNRSMEEVGENDTLVVAAVGNFEHVISAPNLPQAQSFLVSSEEEISDAVDAVNERNITKVKVVGKPTLAEKIANTLENETDAEVDLVSKGAQNAVAQAAKIAKQNRPDFAQKFQKKHIEWRQRVQEVQGKIKQKANSTLERARSLIREQNTTQANQRLQQAQQLFEEGNYTQAREMAREARGQAREQRWEKVKGNATAVRQEVQQEVQSMRERTQELKQMNKQFGQQMSQNMTVQERLQVVEQFQGRRMNKVRQIMDTAVGMGPAAGNAGNWIQKADRQVGKGAGQGATNTTDQGPPGSLGQ